MASATLGVLISLLALREQCSHSGGEGTTTSQGTFETVTKLSSLAPSPRLFWAGVILQDRKLILIWVPSETLYQQLCIINSAPSTMYCSPRRVLLPTDLPLPQIKLCQLGTEERIRRRRNADAALWVSLHLQSGSRLSKSEKPDEKLGNLRNEKTCTPTISNFPAKPVCEGKEEWLSDA